MTHKQYLDISTKEDGAIMCPPYCVLTKLN